MRMTMIWKTENKLFSFSEGRFWSRLVDVYWGPTCEEVFNCSWSVNFPKLTITWNEGIRDDEDEAPDQG